MRNGIVTRERENRDVAAHIIEKAADIMTDPIIITQKCRQIRGFFKDCDRLHHNLVYPF